MASLFLLCLLGPTAARAERQLDGVVNINTASPEELQRLPGVGPAKVRGIIAYRTARAFRTIEELARVKGIGRKMVRKLRLNLAVSGPTTVRIVNPTTGQGNSKRPLDPCPDATETPASGAPAATAVRSPS